MVTPDHSSGGMMMPPTSSRAYDPVAKLLHWVVFLLLAAQYAVGSIMPHIGRNTPDESWVAWHLSIGATILFFIVVRLAWRIAYPVPLARGLPLWQERLASATHWLLYLLVLAMVVLGWAAANARGWDAKMFGLMTLPAIAANGARWGHAAGDIHDWLLYVLAAVIGLHIAGAFYHQYVLQDDEIRRML